jgi:hypothetical protein
LSLGSVVTIGNGFYERPSGLQGSRSINELHALIASS